MDSNEEQEALKTAITMNKEMKAPVEFRIYIAIMNTADVYKLSRLSCDSEWINTTGRVMLALQDCKDKLLHEIK
ncbi:unnamed protein product [Pieris macdunnoughi]|uniref:Uncharacterized protein n=1 Tax=Pieris macdunnoughi TaxID=345717 RepID=A0A821LGL0_9NEOP|nr:unnamed protein product [Pieris macdunnoughi]